MLYIRTKRFIIILLKIYKYLHIVYNFVGYAGTTLFLLRTILVNILNKRHLETGEDYQYQFICQTSYFPQDVLNKYYTIIITMQYIQCLYCCTAGACTDCFFFGLVFHLCGQLEILKIEWQRLGMKKDSGNNAAVNYTNQKNKVDELIKRHKILVTLGENLETSFTITVLIQLMISIILICMSGTYHN